MIACAERRRVSSAAEPWLGPTIVQQPVGQLTWGTRRVSGPLSSSVAARRGAWRRGGYDLPFRSVGFVNKSRRFVRGQASSSPVRKMRNSSDGDRISSWLDSLLFHRNSHFQRLLKSITSLFIRRLSEDIHLSEFAECLMLASLLALPLINVPC